MNDKFRIDSHKLYYHTQRVTDWLNNKLIYPIYIEISPAGLCNHRCIFCSVDFMGYQKRFLPTDIINKRLNDMKKLGVKSIMYAGEGEPLLHKDIVKIIDYTKVKGIDAALTTNGVLMKPEVSKRILKSVEWIKVSCNAGTSETYAKIHNTNENDFNKVISNLENAVNIRNSNGYDCTLGLQTLLIPENVQEVELLTETARNIGLDYLVVKPYTHHSCNLHNYSIDYSHYTYLAENLKKYNTEKFNVVFRLLAMRKWDGKFRPYKKCQALPFWSYIDAGGNLWACSAHLNDQRFNCGNIISDRFQDIWGGPKHLQILEWAETKMNMESCKLNCRMDEINSYLWDLKHPPKHINFI
jgi:wyosine [tRNA(Phe)-imidazoG37] synthetase (radical SAM superfamily)